MRVKFSSYHIEDDGRVTLVFSDGSQTTVAPADLDAHLRGRELARVKRGLELQKRYFRRTLPPWAQAVVGLSVIAAIYTGGRVAGWHVVRRPEPGPPPPAIQTTAAEVAPPRPAGGAPDGQVAGSSSRTSESAASLHSPTKHGEDQVRKSGHEQAILSQLGHDFTDLLE